MSQSSGLASSNAITAVSGFAFWVLVGARHPAAAVGALAVAAPLGQLAGTLASVGYPALLALRIPSVGGPDRRRIVLRSAFVACGAGVLASLLVVMLLELNGAARDLVLVTGPTVAVATVLDGVLVAVGRAWTVSLRQVVFGMTRIVLILAGAWSLEVVWTSALVVSAVASGLALLRHLRSGGPSDPARVRSDADVVRGTTSVHTHLAGLIRVVPLQIAPWLIAAATGPSDAAVFYIGLQVASFALVVPQAIGVTTLVRSMRLPQEVDQAFRAAGRLMWRIMPPTLAGMAIASPFLVRAIGPVYRTAVPVILVLLLTASLESWTALRVASLRFAGEHGRVTIVRVAGTTSAVVAIMLFAPSGLAAGAVGILVGSVVGALAAAVRTLPRDRVRRSPGPPAAWSSGSR